jgi:hypothetical protein
MTEAEIDQAMEATAETLTELKPLMQEVAPQLVG